MGCVASKLEEEEEVVSICRERKKQIKLAVDRRYALAEAHFRYFQSLYAVSAAIRLFVARHSSPSSPYLITFPPVDPSPTPSPEKTKPGQKNDVDAPNMFIEQNNHHHHHHHHLCEEEAKPVKENNGGCDLCDSITTSDDDDEDEEEDERKEEEVVRNVREEPVKEEVCGYYYMQMPLNPPLMTSPQRDFNGWDFFNPFDGVRTEVMSTGGYRRSSDDDLRVVREEEGIPELEEEEGYKGKAEKEQEEKNALMADENGGGNNSQNNDDGVYQEGEVVGVNSNNVGDTEEKKGFGVMDTAEEGRELLEALKDIEDYFIRAYDCGKDLSRMLEVTRVHLQSNMEEIKENSTKLLQTITWHRSISSKPSSCKSLVASSSKSSLTWMECKNDLFDDYGGMDSGSHSSTLGRLYAWEKKLYEEVKAGDATRKLYEKKCSRLRNQDVKGDDEITVGKTRAAVKDLYARILVAIRSAESISKKIQKLRDEELHPQIIELLKGLTRTWRIMLESHETQNKILFEVKTFACPTFSKFCNDSHRLATLQLEAELENWRTRFNEYIAAQKAYIEALQGWLTKFLVPEVEFYSRGKSTTLPSYRANGPTLLVICHDWLSSMEKLPDKSVSYSLRSFSKDMRALWAHQGEEQHQKRKVDNLAKELDRRTLAFKKIEIDFDNHENMYLMEKKDQLDMYRRKLEVEKERHVNRVQETQRITLNGFQTGFCSVFESLVEFSKASLNMYNELVNYSENANKGGSLEYIEGSKAEENGSR